MTTRNILVPAFALAATSAFYVLAARESNAPGRPTSSLLAPHSAEKAPDAEGFMQRWLILEPIRVGRQLTDSVVQAEINREYFPGQLAVIPHDGQKVAVDGTDLTWHAIDTRNYNVNLYHFAHAYGKPSSDVLFWAVTIVNCPREIPDVRLAIGSNAGSVWWVNGKQVIGIYGDRQTVIDDGVSKRLILRKGANIVRCAVINGAGATDFCARFLDKDGNPLKGFTLSLAKPAQ